MFYQLKVIRKKSKPPIWRRVAIPSNITFAQLAVILQKLLEFERSNDYEFEFYSAKVRFAEWSEETDFRPDFYYSYYNAPDTYINKWMTENKAFTFRMFGAGSVLLEYRLEIEKILEKIEEKESGKKLNCPIIMKQVSDRVDLYWSNPNMINDEMKQRYFLTRGEEKYQCTSKIFEQINRGEGITFSENTNDRDIHTKKSPNVQLSEFAEQLRNKSEVEKRECKFEAYLTACDKEGLIELAEELGLTNLPQRKDRLVKELARCLLKETTMKARLLQLDEIQLDAFEAVIEDGPFVPTDLEWEELYPVYELDYLSLYSDQTVQVPDEVISLYQEIQKEGYREYHKKASWLLKCIRVACFLYMSIPFDVLFQMYSKNRAVRIEYPEFCELLKTIPDNVSGCILKENKLVFKEIYITGAYKHLENIRCGSFYIPNINEIDALDRDKYPSNEKEYQSLLTFFQKELDCPFDFSIYLCQLAYQIISGGGLLIDYLDILNGMGIEFKSERNADQFVSIMKNVNNATRMIEFKGNKPNEMHRLGIDSKNTKNANPRQRVKKKISPNAPCPCGSGKKYKKCCRK